MPLSETFAMSMVGVDHRRLDVQPIEPRYRRTQGSIRKIYPPTLIISATGVGEAAFDLLTLAGVVDPPRRQGNDPLISRGVDGDIDHQGEVRQGSTRPCRHPRHTRHLRRPGNPRELGLCPTSTVARFDDSFRFRQRRHQIRHHATRCEVERRCSRCGLITRIHRHEPTVADRSTPQITVNPSKTSVDRFIITSPCCEQC